MHVRRLPSPATTGATLATAATSSTESASAPIGTAAKPLPDSAPTFELHRRLL